MNIDSVLDSVRSWPIDHKLRLIEQLWDQVADAVPDADLSDDLKAFLNSRLQEDDEAPDDTVPWDQVWSEATARFSQ